MNYIEQVANDIRSNVDPSELPDGDLNVLFLIYAVLALSKGDSVTNKDVHDAWSAWKSQSDPAHESIVPYKTLDQETREEDTVFTLAIRLAAHKLAEVSPKSS